VAEATARLAATIARLEARTAADRAAVAAQAASQPPKPVRTPSPLALLVWAAHQAK
jgi:hypothetical protein